MPGTPTTNHAIPTLAGTTLARDIDSEVNAALTAIDTKMVAHSSGPLSSRPTSSGGSPGVVDRIYRATDATPDKIYIDNGTGWDEFITGVIRGGVDLAGGIYAGSGFTVSSNTAVNPGIYTILFTVAFSTPPIVVAMATEVGNYVSAFSVATSQASLRVRSDAGALINSSFMFIAMPA